MNSSMKQILYNTAALTFEDLGFLFPTPTLSDTQQQAQADAAMRVDFHGPLTGRLVVRLFGNLLPILTVNMLGEEESPPIQLQHDALGEITNVLCGNVLPRLSDTQAEFHLQAPVFVSEDDVPEYPSADPSTVDAQIGLEEHGRAEVILHIYDRDVSSGVHDAESELVTP